MVDDGPDLECNDGERQGPVSLDCGAALDRDDLLYLRHVRPWPAEPRSARADDGGLLCPATRPILDVGKSVCARNRDQGFSGRRASLSALAPAVGIGRERADLSSCVSAD